jgi:hypothetical protein
MLLKNITAIFTIFAFAVTGWSGENLLENASFEQGDKSPEKWVRYLISSDQAVYGEEAARSGKRGVGVTSTTHKYGGGWNYEKIIPVVAGEKYCLSGWIKSNSWGGNNISIAWFGVKDGRPRWKLTNRSKFVNGRKDWTRVKLNVTVPQGVKFAKITVGRKWKAEGSVYFDDICLEKISGSSAAEIAKTLQIPWQKAIPAENIPVGKPLSKEIIPLSKWRENRADAGTLTRTGSKLEISNTALHGVGWISPEIKVLPGQVYALTADVKLKKAYHVALGAVFYDAKGKFIVIRKGKALRGSLKTSQKLVVRTPAKNTTMRFLLTQSRSSGTSSFSNLTLVKCGAKQK